MNTKMRDLSDIEHQLVGAGSVGDPIGSYGGPSETGKDSASPPSITSGGRITPRFLGPPATN
jgi:hypothetical protein